MRNFKEHNNREISKKLAEYITGIELRKYVARKVKEYLNIENPIVFDGAVGSGQLEQFVNPSMLYGVDVQENSINSARENFKNSELEIKSFFEYEKESLEVDCVVMNPPFSIKFKDLSEKEQKNIQKEFIWKKSGCVDDIFVLKSLKYTKRFGFYILFPGVGYRRTEETFRKLIGNNLAELNRIDNAFTDTGISVLFIVVDKEKNDNKVFREIYDCKLDKQILTDEWILEDNYSWQQPQEERKVEEVDINALNTKASELWISGVKKNLELDLFLVQECNANIDILGNIKRLKSICKEFERKLRCCRNYKSSMTVLEKQSKLLSLFEATQR
ncbi:N-6 DNA methylase [Fusobacterium hwasookii]|uniref:N-6 DNA methylase n=1 Tax=Fusobacterium hwasookii ChDC F206 TaxID=1307443 RepID=A0AAC8WK23_9FUSO|nr:N-6 DNA methylase [Fusobacterium hwasookii]ALQ35520.1 N-6 DNA methylase [Fusobacterium hwasookii ChDC F206]